MKKDYFNSFEESDFRICEDIEFDGEYNNLLVPLEAWFDVDKKFGINTLNDANVWVNLYAEYNPATNDIRMFYDIDADDGVYEREYVMTHEECNTLIPYIEKMCIQQHNMTCMEFYITEYAENCDCEINLACRQTESGCEVYNTNDGAVLYQESRGGNLYKHIGHSIELANYGDADCYSIECIDCNEVLFSSDAERVRLQEIEDNGGQQINM